MLRRKAAHTSSSLGRRVSEKLFVAINGDRQGMFLEARDATSPVLLFLHGGIPETFLAHRYPTGLENLFVVATWERRASGISFRPGQPTTALSVEQLVDDTVVVADYLRQRFAQERIYVMAHSGGSFIGIQAVAASPDRFAAYVGVGQMAAQLESEILAHAYMVEQFRALGDGRMVARLEAAPVTSATGTPDAYLALRDVAMHRLGIGTMHEMHSIVTGLLLPSLQFPGYTIREKINLWRAKRAQGVSLMWDQMLATDLAELVPALAVPAYFLHGAYDYTCAYEVARAYAARLTAPVKGFYTFEQSAHSPMFEEPGRTVRIMLEDVLAGGTSLADTQLPVPELRRA